MYTLCLLQVKVQRFYIPLSAAADVNVRSDFKHDAVTENTVLQIGHLMNMLPCMHICRCIITQEIVFHVVLIYYVMQQHHRNHMRLNEHSVQHGWKVFCVRQPPMASDRLGIHLTKMNELQMVLYGCSVLYACQTNCANMTDWSLYIVYNVVL